ncbi:hypothetical protein B0H10DRAFT_193357 [Mycena sp. CBHHK59/15]|nr:hypothetical protein B0H10DRAFT_193357 [Mycena sp. CBHHK59/15]
MAIILNLPVELVAKILRGMFLCDILSTTQTCCYLRSISLNNRNIWAHAQDCEIIPLPPGETLASINVDILPRYVRRAISLGQRWKEPINSSVRHFEPRFHDLPTWRPWVLPPSPDHLGFKSPQWCRILPGGQSFLIGKPFPSRVGLYGLNGTWGHLFDFRGQVSFVGWSSTDNGASLTLILVVLNKENGILCKRLCIYDVQYDLTTIQPMKPTVSQPRYICLPIFILPKGLSVQRSIVLTWDTDSLCLVDLTTNEALHLQSAPHNKSSRIIHAALHPSIPFTVVLLCEQDTSKTRILSVVSNISNLETLPSAECYELKPRELILRDIVKVDIPDPERQLYLPGLPYFVFHKRGENIAIDDSASRFLDRHPQPSKIPATTSGHVKHNLDSCSCSSCGEIGFIFVSMTAWRHSFLWIQLQRGSYSAIAFILRV